MESIGTVLVVDDDAQGRQLAADALGDAGFQVCLAADAAEGLRLVREQQPHVVVLDRMMPGTSGDEMVSLIRRDPELKGVKIIIVSVKSSTDERIAGLNLGVDDYLAKPYSGRELIARVSVQVRTKRAEDALQHAYGEVERKVEERTRELTRTNERLLIEIAEREKAQAALGRALGEVERLKTRLEAENIYLQDEIKTAHRFDGIVGGSEPVRQLLRRIEQVAPTDASVLILGESGTGKELVARAIHQASRRRERSLVKVNCAALPAQLIESDFFGHERGAFTGAAARKIGRFELADGGTIFLDEIGELPLELQAKLLRILQEGEFERLGSPQTVKADVRVLAASNRDLTRATERGEFRRDLFYRLNVFPVVCPPLRERKEDIPILAGHFVRKHGARFGKRIDSVFLAAGQKLRAYDWPGNIRELENVIERAMILSSGPVLDLEEPPLPGTPSASAQPVQGSLREVEIVTIRRILEDCDWVIEGERCAARRLGMEPSTLRSRMRKYGIRRPTQE